MKLDRSRPGAASCRDLADLPIMEANVLCLESYGSAHSGPWAAQSR